MPAYELGILKTENEFDFEKHLLECDYCHRVLSELMPYSVFMRNDEKVKNDLKPETEKVFLGSAEIESNKPLSKNAILRPALLYSLLILLSVTCILLLFQDKETIKAVQHISLASVRSAESATILSSPGSDAVISFYYPKPESDRPYVLAIIDFKGDTVMTVDNYNFERTPIGYIYFPHSKMRPGQYELIIFDSADSTFGALKKFTFHIAE